MQSVDSVSATWDLAFAGLESDLQKEEIERLQKEAERKNKG